MSNLEEENIQAQNHFDSPIHLTLSDAEHFNREGFSGDIFIPKEAKMGFTALRVEVYGKHPRKEILKGNTRSYYVVDGEGTFTLNEESRVVGAGDLIVIPPDNEYEYRGIMTLFEFNVSRRNSFRDRLVVKPSEEPDLEFEARQAAKPHREALARALGALLSRGYTLTMPEITDILPYYNFSAKSKANQVISFGFRDLIGKFGVYVDVQKYKGRLVCADYNLPADETDIEKTKSKIDEEFRNRVEVRKQTRQDLN